MRSIFNGMGYLLNDNRSSGGALEEADMISCNHCQALLRRKQWQDDGGFCHCCNAPVCAACADAMDHARPSPVTGQAVAGCTPFLKVVDQQLEDAYRRDQNAKILGT